MKKRKSTEHFEGVGVEWHKNILGFETINLKVHEEMGFPRADSRLHSSTREKHANQVACPLQLKFPMFHI